ncbi:MULTISPECIES: YdbH domain-containing protein [unclassified Pseudoalteromonas]|uniref:YdbH domain-containing protein n=1 Tax=unclassified Pseudoalteromonas TaxID=194690 RepID=UPI0025B4C9C2|nr:MULTISPECIES: YdbH domain-containing protein [unclassified Pseudoalteromonas]MDN3378244.1 YdbH domain-containing protein [Pseudoalteromonas sp. APC 3893]MDN3386164.1 YdbH domain-containing protein [Pseudoalteromonas sp. APC 4017]
MIKRIAWGIVFLLLSVLTLGYVFRMPITQWAIAPSLSQSGVELHCLDWSLNSNISLSVNRLCLTYQGHQIELGGIIADTKKITVGRANLRLNDSESDSSSNEPFKKLALNLPKERPKIEIKRLLITHPQLHDELTVSIDEERLNTFVVSGDVTAEVVVNNHKVAGRFNLADGLLTKIKPLPALTLNSVHAFTFDGLSVDIKSDIDAEFTQEFSQCPVMLNAFGDVNTHYHLNDNKVSLDAQQLTSWVAFDSACLALINNQSQREFIFKQLPLKWQIMLSDTIKFENEQLVMPSMLLNAKNSDAKLSLTNLAINLQQPLEQAKGDIKLLFISEDIEQVEVNAALNNLAINGDYQLSIDELPNFLPASAKKIASRGQFKIENVLQLQQNANITSEFTFAELKFDKLTAKDYKAQFTTKLDDKQNIHASLNSQLRSVTYEQYQLLGVNNQLSASSSLAVGELFVDLNSETKLAQFNSDFLNLSNIRISSKGLQSRALQASHHVFIDEIELVASHHVSAVEHPFEITIAEQAATKLNPVLQQFEPLATLTDGSFNGVVRGDVNLQQAEFTLQVEQLSGLYNDYLAKHFSSRLTGNYNSGQLNVAPTTFELNELRAGAVVSNMAGNLSIDNSVARAYQLTGDVLGGRFALDSYKMTKEAQQSLVIFENIDASKLITLDDKSGITLTGQVNGRLPVYFDQQGISVKSGELSNQGTGKLIITDNAAFDAVKAQQQELSPILSLLEDLDIQGLKSSVDLNSDGWLYLGVNLKGYNEEQAQQVNFNYNHEENVFTLLRALRLSDEITQKVEQEYSTKGTKND